MISRDDILAKLDYHPIAGVFVWKINSGRARAGNIAGCVKDGYIVIRLNGKLHFAHRLAWFLMRGDWPEAIDHINHDRADNRIDNLRPANKKINGRNAALSKNNKSGICGVHWHQHQVKNYGGWVAQIKYNGITHYLGHFKDFFEACCARKAAELQYDFHLNHGKRRC